VRAVELNPRSSELRYALGVFLMRHNQSSEAIAQLAEALKLNPGFTAAEEALRQVQQASRSDETNP
ncbi:MAG TPA: tetratricopeptide repeat protein, partial [Planctomycetaceae bacterium]|nr:tetratricopeptide repeat protein [Planctomycetaceae bacterium]